MKAWYMSDATDETLQYWGAQYCFAAAAFYRDSPKWWRRAVEREVTRRGLPRVHLPDHKWWVGLSREQKVRHMKIMLSK